MEHLAQAQDFVIQSEEGIAKGVRRIIAYTREAAKASRRRAEELRAAIQQASHCPDELLNERYNQLNVMLRDGDMSLVDRREAEAGLAVLFKRLKEVLKKFEAARKERLSTWIEESKKKWTAAGAKFVAVECDVRRFIAATSCRPRSFLRALCMLCACVRVCCFGCVTVVRC